MDEFEKKQNLPVRAEMVQFAAPPEEMPEQADPVETILLPILRRWPIVLLVFLMVFGAGVTAIYFMMGKKFDTQAAIHISTIVSPIMFQSEDRLPPYELYKNTQAELIGGDIVLNRAIDELKDKNIIFFQSGEDPLIKLRKMFVNQAISIETPRQNELIYLKMTTDYPRDAELVIDALIQGYMSIVVSEETRGDDEKLTVLEKRRRILEDQMEVQRLKIRQRAEEYGTSELTSRQEMMLQQVATLQNELIEITIRRILLETQVALKEKNLNREITEEDIAGQQTDVVESDPVVQSLRQDIRRYEGIVRENRAIMHESNPALKRNIENLEDFQRQLERRRAAVALQVKEQVKKQIVRTQKKELEQLQEELNQTTVYENRIRAKLDETDMDTIGLGRKQFEIQDAQEQLDQTKIIYNELCRRIEEINIERSRQPRISVASNARSVEAKGKRRKMAGAAAFGGLALGMGVALLLDRLDKRLKTPRDIAKRISVRVLGTTTDPHGVDKKLLPQQIIDDYQTIRANMSLWEECKDSKVIAVTSSGMGDGKTTFSVNLATTFARSGKRTLLIDGDLRKPDVGLIMKLPHDLRGLQDYLFGMDVEKAVYKIPSLDLFVLSSDKRNTGDALELITMSESIERIQSLRDQYDYIIIDTPPVLAFSDALVWAKMADGTILVSFVGHTSKVDMQEAANRLEQIKAKILGTVVNNVKVYHGYQKYGYGYGYGNSKASEEKRKAFKKNALSTLLVPDSTNSNLSDSQNGGPA